jgi:hypothetical protein
VKNRAFLWENPIFLERFDGIIPFLMFSTLYHIHICCQEMYSVARLRRWGRVPWRKGYYVHTKCIYLCILYNVHMELITAQGFRKLLLTTCVAIWGVTACKKSDEFKIKTTPELLGFV